MQPCAPAVAVAIVAALALVGPAAAWAPSALAGGWTAEYVVSAGTTNCYVQAHARFSANGLNLALRAVQTGGPASPCAQPEIDGEAQYTVLWDDEVEGAAGTRTANCSLVAMDEGPAEGMLFGASVVSASFVVYPNGSTFTAWLAFNSSQAPAPVGFQWPWNRFATAAGSDAALLQGSWKGTTGDSDKSTPTQAVRVAVDGPSFSSFLPGNLLSFRGLHTINEASKRWTNYFLPTGKMPGGAVQGCSYEVSSDQLVIVCGPPGDGPPVFPPINSTAATTSTTTLTRVTGSTSDD